MASKSPESLQAEQLLINFPPEGMPPIIAQAVADHARIEGKHVVATGDWWGIHRQMLNTEVDEDIASRRQTGLELISR